MIRRLSKKKMLWLLDMRPELPECFKKDDRDKYRKTVEEWHAWCRGRVFFEQGDRVVVTNDFDGMDGEGREAHRIGKVAEVTMTPTTHPLMHHPGNGGGEKWYWSEGRWRRFTDCLRVTRFRQSLIVSWSLRTDKESRGGLAFILGLTERTRKENNHDGY